MSENLDLHHQIIVLKIKVEYFILVILSILDILSTYIALRIGLIEGNAFTVLMMYKTTFITVASLKMLVIGIFGVWLFYRLHSAKKRPEEAAEADWIITASMFFLLGFQFCLVFNNFMMILLQLT